MVVSLCVTRCALGAYVMGGGVDFSKISVKVSLIWGYA